MLAASGNGYNIGNRDLGEFLTALPMLRRYAGEIERSGVARWDAIGTDGDTVVIVEIAGRPDDETDKGMRYWASVKRLMAGSDPVVEGMSFEDYCRQVGRLYFAEREANEEFRLHFQTRGDIHT